MKETLRIDKYLCDMGVGTRSEVKGYLKKGRAYVNGQLIKSADLKVNIKEDEVLFDGQRLCYNKYEYYMLNKPAGVVSATVDNLNKTVIDLIIGAQSKDIFPVGRLDKDTEGLLLITNDGELAHQLLSPKKQVGKKYYAKIVGKVTEEDVDIFRKGIAIEEGFTTSPAILTILQSGEVSEIEVTIYEGKFHQIKRMFHAVGKEVTYLKRLSMGNLNLDPDLEVGEYRILTEEEINSLKNTNMR